MNPLAERNPAPTPLTPQAQKEWDKVPPPDQLQVTLALFRLQNGVAELARYRAMDTRFGSAGRYEAEAWHNRTCKETQQAREALDEFRGLAATNGVDAGLILACYEPIPMPTLSENAQGWYDEVFARPAEAVEEAAPSRQRG